MLENSKILSVNSPRTNVKGPYSVLYKTDYWAIVALKYDNSPCLGIRWFDEDGKGNPTSHGIPTWFVIPEELCGSLISSLPLRNDVRSKTIKFLDGEFDPEKQSNT